MHEKKPKTALASWAPSINIIVIIIITVQQLNYVFRAKKHHAVYFNDLKEATTNNKGVINHLKCVY